MAHVTELTRTAEVPIKAKIANNGTTADGHVIVQAGTFRQTYRKARANHAQGKDYHICEMSDAKTNHYLELGTKL